MRPVPVRVRGLARLELIQFRDRYNTIKPGLGSDLERLFLSRLDLIAMFPEMHAIGYGGLRHFKLPRFPVLVYYRFSDEVVTVAALIHASRDQHQALKDR